MQFKEYVLAHNSTETSVLSQHHHVLEGQCFLRGVVSFFIAKIDVNRFQGVSPIFNLITRSPQTLFIIIAMLIFFGSRSVITFRLHEISSTRR
jgi:hypothetical protein